MLFLIVLCLYFRAKDLKLREFFEKQFPELKKQREDKERISRVSQRIRSDAEWEEIIDGLQEQEVISSFMCGYSKKLITIIVILKIPFVP